MAVTMRDSWTDERLDDLSKRMDDGFHEVRDEIRTLRSEVKADFAGVDAKFAAIDARFDSLQQTIIVVGGGLIGTLVLGIATVLATQA